MWRHCNYNSSNRLNSLTAHIFVVLGAAARNLHRSFAEPLLGLLVLDFTRTNLQLVRVMRHTPHQANVLVVAPVASR